MEIENETTIRITQEEYYDLSIRPLKIEVLGNSITIIVKRGN